MVVLLRDLKTGLYFGRENVWVGKPEGATDFGTVEAAGCGAKGCVGEDVAVVLRYDNPECELALNPAFCMTPLPRAPDFVNNASGRKTGGARRAFQIGR